MRNTFTYDPSIQVTPQRGATVAALNVCFPESQSTPLAFS